MTTKKTVRGLAFGLGLWLLPILVANAAPQHTGIQGQAFLIISYGIPIEVAPGIWVGIPSMQLPTATSFTVISASAQREVARVTTDASGFYSVSLNPGRYVLVPDALTILPGCSASTEPIEITVRPKEVTLANIFYFRQGPCRVQAVPQ